MAPAHDPLSANMSIDAFPDSGRHSKSSKILLRLRAQWPQAYISSPPHPIPLSSSSSYYISWRGILAVRRPCPAFLQRSVKSTVATVYHPVTALVDICNRSAAGIQSISIAQQRLPGMYRLTPPPFLLYSLTAIMNACWMCSSRKVRLAGYEHRESVEAILCECHPVNDHLVRKTW